MRLLMATFLVGRRCVAVARIYHEMDGEVDRSTGALELSWSAGKHTVIDAASDWTLQIEDGPWTDPLGGATSDEMEAARLEVGEWHRQDVTEQLPYASIAGRLVVSVQEVHDEVGQLVGLMIDFGTAAITCRLWEGNLHVLASARESPEGP